MLGRIFMAALVVVAWATVAWAGDSPAKLAYQKGLVAYNLGRFDDALGAFTEAYEKSADPALLWNIAQCQRQLGQRASAARSYRAYVRQVPDGAPYRDQAVRMAAEQEAPLPSPPPSPPPSPAVVAAPPPPAAAPAGDVVRPAPAAARRPWYRKPPGVAMASIGLAGLAAGAIVLSRGASDDSASRSAASLPDQRRLFDDGQTLTTAGIATLAVGGAALVTGAVLLVVLR